jgi:signal transduction histidine kinase
MASKPPRSLSDLDIFEQVHTALGLTAKLDDFYTVFASLLVDPMVLSLSRVFILRDDEKKEALTGRLALGASTRTEHKLFRNQLESETSRINEMIEMVQSESPEPHAIDALLNLRFHAIWIQMLQSSENEARAGEGVSMNSAFQGFLLPKSLVAKDSCLGRILSQPHAFILADEDGLPPSLGSLLEYPALLGRLVTKRGVHAVVLADAAFEERPTITQEMVARFQTVLNLASVALENVELVQELTETTERLRQMDRLKTNFLSIVSHELRTPLTSILGFVSLVADQKVGPLADPQRDLLSRVVNHCLHLQDMVNDLMEVGELESGGILDYTVQAVDPLAILLNVIPTVNARRSVKRPRIEPGIGADGVPLIRGDSKALQRILFHLIDNAVKFSTGDEAVVRVEFTVVGGSLEISVCDQGIGIPTDQLKRIWERFYQVDYRLERAYGGMGIGLNIVKMLLDATNGQIRVESSVGAGSRFTVSYPLAPSK